MLHCCSCCCWRLKGCNDGRGANANSISVLARAASRRPGSAHVTPGGGVGGSESPCYISYFFQCYPCCAEPPSTLWSSSLRATGSCERGEGKGGERGKGRMAQILCRAGADAHRAARNERLALCRLARHDESLKYSLASSCLVGLGTQHTINSTVGFTPLNFSFVAAWLLLRLGGRRSTSHGMSAHQPRAQILRILTTTMSVLFELIPTSPPACPVTGRRDISVLSLWV